MPTISNRLNYEIDLPGGITIPGRGSVTVDSDQIADPLTWRNLWPQLETGDLTLEDIAPDDVPPDAEPVNTPAADPAPPPSDPKTKG